MPAVPHPSLSDRSLVLQSTVAARAAADFEKGMAHVTLPRVDSGAGPHSTRCSQPNKAIVYYIWRAGHFRPRSTRWKGSKAMSLGTILVIILIIFLLGGFSGRFGGYGYGYGHGGVGVLGTILIIVVILMLVGRI